MKSIYRRIKNIVSIIHRIAYSQQFSYKSPKFNLGQIQSFINSSRSDVNSLHDVEFQVFSQWGDDGIIQYLINKLKIKSKYFIEFGVENYTESNTRFLAFNNHWCGYVIDGSIENITFIKNDSVSWACELYSENAFITKENINDLLKIPGFPTEIGLLSIDIDGNDYWIWKEINTINPIIVICEYNSLFGYNSPYTIPYDSNFVRGKKYPKNFYGSSLMSLSDLGKEKGYSLIGCNSAGNNCYFVRNDYLELSGFNQLSVKEAYVPARFSEVIMKSGGFLRGVERLKILNGLNVFNTRTQTVEIFNFDRIR